MKSVKTINKVKITIDKDYLNFTKGHLQLEVYIGAATFIRELTINKLYGKNDTLTSFTSCGIVSLEDIQDLIDCLRVVNDYCKKENVKINKKLSVNRLKELKMKKFITSKLTKSEQRYLNLARYNERL